MPRAPYRASEGKQQPTMPYHPTLTSSSYIIHLINVNHMTIAKSDVKQYSTTTTTTTVWAHTMSQMSHKKHFYAILSYINCLQGI